MTAATPTSVVAIESLDSEGRGVARVDGKAVFVEGALPGERVAIETLKRKPSWELARSVVVERASPDRTVPRCAHFGICGGCSLQHASPALQLAAKQRSLEDALARIGRVSPSILLPPIHGPAWGYRARARLSVRNVPKKGGVLVGFHERGSSYVADMTSCEVMPAAISAMLVPLRRLVESLSIRDRMPQIEVSIGADVTVLVFRVLVPLTAADESALRAFADTHGVQIWLQPKGPESARPFHPVLAPALDYRLPDFGVPYNRFGTNRPFTEGFTNRNLWYGFVNRDFQRIRQDIGTAGVEYQLNDHVTLSSRFRRQQSLLDYVGTLAQGASFASAIPGGQVNLSPQSRYQQTAVIASQNDATIKFDTGPVMHTSVVGTEISHEQITRDTYTGLASELFGGGAFNGGGTTVGGILFPPNLLPFNTKPTLAGNPTNIVVDSKSAYLIHNANYNDFIILNGGLRMDDYRISSYAPTVAAAAVLNPGVASLRNNFFNAYAGNHSTLFNYNAGLVVKPLPGWSLYAAYATSANPVGAELDGSAAAYGALNAATSVFAPERNRSIEVGSKLELFEKRLLLTAALFRTSKSNAREVFGANVFASGAYEIQGLDLGASGKITDRWSVFGGLVLMQSKVTQSKAPTNVGLPLANLAHASFSLLTKYQLTDKLEVGGQAVYNSRRYGGSLLAANGGAAISSTTFLPAPTAANPFLNVPTVLPSYWRFDAFAEYKITQNLTAKVQALNIFNRTYYDAFYQSAAPFAQIAPGRSVQFSMKASF